MSPRKRLAGRVCSDAAAEVCFLNERDDPGHSVVTWPSTAFLLQALNVNLMRSDELHDYVKRLADMFAGETPAAERPPTDSTNA